MDATLGFLARLDPHNRQGNVAPKSFAQQLLCRQMAKKVLANLIERYNGFAVVLRHQQKQRGG